MNNDCESVCISWCDQMKLGLLCVQILSQCECEHQQHEASSLQDELHVKDSLRLWLARVMLDVM